MKFNLQAVGIILIIILLIFLIYPSILPNNNMIPVIIPPRRVNNWSVNTWRPWRPWRPRRPIPAQHILGPGGQQWVF